MNATVPDRPNLALERMAGAEPVCGVDEVGRGPWAGPLLAAAAILDPQAIPDGIDDSKRLSAKKREALAKALEGCAEIGIGVVTVEELDRIGLTAANDAAIRRAVQNLPRRPGYALVDGRRLPPGLPCPALAVVKGDATSLSIAAASIVAKVARDRIMRDLARDCPGYGWERNAGYGVAEHRKALETLGITRHHRRCFQPISRILREVHPVEY